MEQNTQIALRPVKNAAIVQRREMAKNTALLNALETIDRALFIASTEKTVAEYSAGELSAELAVALKWICKDVGYRVADEGDRQYLIIRTAEILKRYYATFTLKDFKMAFEMAITGELDDYLPKGRDGQPDRNHYQQFNAEYICKILNAYKARRNRALKKAAELMPPAPKERDYEQEKVYRNACRRTLIEAFEYFREHWALPVMFNTTEMLCYRYLSEAGLVEPREITGEEQQRIITGDMYMLAGSGQNFMTERHNELERIFAQMVNDGVDINDYITFE